MEEAKKSSLADWLKKLNDVLSQYPPEFFVFCEYPALPWLWML